MEMKSIRVESSLFNKELTIIWETDMGRTELGVLLTMSRSDGWYFVIIRDENGHFLEVMRMADESKKEYKIFQTKLEHEFGTIELEVVIDVEYKRWYVEVK